MKLASKYFYGHEVSKYGQEHNRLDYATLAKAFDAVMANDLIEATNKADLGYWEQVSGIIDYQDDIDELEDQIAKLDDQRIQEEEKDDPDNDKIDQLSDKIDELEKDVDELQYEMDNPPEVFQWFIVDNHGFQILEEVGEVVYYNEELDLYLWGVTHCGTSWDYVLTNVKINCGYED